MDSFATGAGVRINLLGHNIDEVVRLLLSGCTSPRATLDRIIDAKLALGHRNATVNRTRELVRAILRKCVTDWEWLDRAPKYAC